MKIFKNETLNHYFIVPFFGFIGVFGTLYSIGYGAYHLYKTKDVMEAWLMIIPMVFFFGAFILSFIYEENSRTEKAKKDYDKKYNPDNATFISANIKDHEIANGQFVLYRNSTEWIVIDKWEGGKIRIFVPSYKNVRIIGKNMKILQKITLEDLPRRVM